MRMKRAEEEKYQRNLSLALAEYKNRVARFDVPSADWFIKHFHLVRNGTPITSKRWHNIICRTDDLISYREAARRRNQAILNDLSSEISKQTILSRYKLTDGQLKSVLNKSILTLKEESRRFVESVCDLYQKGCSIAFIEKELRISAPTITKLLTLRNIPRRSQSETSIRYPDVCIEYFKNIDSPEKAWILGFIYADGSISRKNSLQISQSTENDHLLQIVADELNYPGGFTAATKSHTDKLQSVLTISRREIFLDLLNLGMTRNKESDLRFPFSTIRQKYYWAFLSGFYNGDGGLAFGLKKNPSVKANSPGWVSALNWHITSTRDMCQDIAFFLECQVPKIKTNVRQDRKKNAWRISISSNRLHILSVVWELDRHAYGIQISDKFDKAVFYQRRRRRNAAIRAVRNFPEANLFKDFLKAHVDSQKGQGLELKDIAENLRTDRNSLRRFYHGQSFPATIRVLSRFCELLGLREKDFIDWSLLESHQKIPSSWELKDHSYHYHGFQVGLFGEVVELGEKNKWNPARKR